jgi:parallel beta-helix repeat protein
MHSKLLPTLRAAVVCTLSLLTTASLAQTINVGPGQTYTTIQSGINAASSGDTVLVGPGTYNENIDFKGKAITVTSSGGAASTIIDGGQTAPAVVFTTSETRASILSGFTIQHGGFFNYMFGANGGIYLSYSSPTILNNILTQNNCWTIYSSMSAPLIEGNEISATQDVNVRCSFGGGAGIYISGNLNSSDTTNMHTSAIILGNTIENNVESGLEDAGGNGGAGIAVWGGNPIIMNNIIRNNASPGGSGGAINLEFGVGVVIVQNLMYGNSVGCGGGALAVQANPDPRTGIAALIANNTIVDNVSTANAGYSECTLISQIYPGPDSYGSGNPAVLIINNIISGSTSYPAVNCSWFDPPSEADQPTFENNILLNSGGPFFGSYCVDVSGKYDDIVSDPQFVNPCARLSPAEPVAGDRQRTEQRAANLSDHDRHGFLKGL